MGSQRLLSLVALSWVAVICSGEPEVTELDTRAGADVTLQCRYRPDAAQELIFYWVRTTANTHDNVAVNEVPLQLNYKVLNRPEEGKYDLLIHNASFEGENGRFECRVKAAGTGHVVTSQVYRVVVLVPPAPPTLTPGGKVHAREGQPLQLACTSTGGSPPPTIKWYRDGSPYPLESETTTANGTSTSLLPLAPGKAEDGAHFKCVVWNRAMPASQNLEATVDLSVSYFPRVSVGPETPLRVELGAPATLECRVDAKPAARVVQWTRDNKPVTNSATYHLPAVSADDAGRYNCLADNGLERTGDAELYLDVLYPPTVTVRTKTYEVEEGGRVEIRCDIVSNPEPIVVEWLLEGKPDFKQKSDTLLLEKVNAEMAGTYTCRAVNVIARVERSGSASVAVLVRHRPGAAAVTPERAVAAEGAAVTLACAASPPGWPAPQYRWFRDAAPSDARPAVLATGNKYTIPHVHLGSEGLYFCQATNELGHGEPASVALEVHQPPRFQTKMLPHVNKPTHERDFAVTCSAVGKPKPAVRWLKDGVDIPPDSPLYQLVTDVSEGSNAVYNVQSSLKFSGASRTNANQLMPDDRGLYTCVFENTLKKIESVMHLRIEHEPIPVQQQTKVAADLSETGEIVCRVIAFPKPEFQWYFGSTPLDTTSDGRYTVDTSSDSNDAYKSSLRIRNIKSQDYGEYFCKIKNSFGVIKPAIRLQAKGAPERPEGVTAAGVGPTSVTLGWEAGFDGGLRAKYFVSYRRGAGAGCPQRPAPPGPHEYDCGRTNPCNVTNLEPHQTYHFKVKAVNTKGQSNYSSEITASTLLEAIPPPEQVTYEPGTRALAFSAAAACLPLVGVAEALAPARDRPGLAWQLVAYVDAQPSLDQPTFHDAIVDYSPALKPARLGGRGAGGGDEGSPRVRLKLCLKTDHDFCSDYTEAEIGPSYITSAGGWGAGTVAWSAASALVVAACGALLVAFCRCRRRRPPSKEYEMDAMRPDQAQHHAPPPYYPADSGMENKALEHSMELGLSLEEAKAGVYAAPAPYSPYSHTHAQNITNNDWSPMGYMDTNYANSTGGGGGGGGAGSVNSQDSLWQMKMAGGGGGAPYAAHYDHYDGDYAPYPRVPERGYPAAAAAARDYCSDPYASVHKPKKRMDQHIESPYHEVSGLPELGVGGGGGGGGGDVSGYSTPDARARRVIREIIV